MTDDDERSARYRDPRDVQLVRHHVHFPPDGRHFDREMRIVGEDWPARRGPRPVDDPAVATSLAVRRQPFEAGGIVDRQIVRSSIGRSSIGLDASAFCQLPLPICRTQRPLTLCPSPLPSCEAEYRRRPLRWLWEQFGRSGAQHLKQLVPQQLGPVVLTQPPGEQLSDRQRIDRRPWLRSKTEQLVLEGKFARGRHSSPRSHRRHSFRTRDEHAE